MTDLTPDPDRKDETERKPWSLVIDAARLRKWGKGAAPIVLALAALAVITWVLLDLREPDGGGSPARTDCRSQLTPDERDAADARPPGTGGLGVVGSASTVAGESLPQPIDASGQPVAGARLEFPFGADRTAMVRYQPIRLPDGMTGKDVEVDVPFGDVAPEEGRPLPRRQARGYVFGDDDAKVVTVAICVNPLLPSEIRPDRYTGTALVGDGDRATALTFEITAQDDRKGYVIFAALLGVIAGLVMKLYADHRDPLLPRDTPRNARSPRTLIAIGAGIVAGVYSYLTIYADDPTFAAEFGNLWRVTAETFAGTLAAKALTDLTGKGTERDKAQIAAEAAAKQAGK